MNKAPLPFEDVKLQIEKAKSITILSHINPDADTLGTALGIYALLKKALNIKIELVNASLALPRYLDFLPAFKKIKHKMDYTDSLVIICDCGSLDRIGFDLEGREILNIDHHLSNTHYGQVNVVIPEAASSSYVAYKLFEPYYTINEEAATCFYAALLSDTRYFTTTSVNEEVFSVAMSLVKQGAKADEIAYNFTQRRSLASIRILERALSSLTLHSDAKIAVQYVSQKDIDETGATMPDVEGIVDYGRSLATVQMALFAVEVPHGIRISLRSKSIDITPLALAFGGGGHKVAVGFTLKNMTLQESIDTILEKIEKLGIIHEK